MTILIVFAWVVYVWVVVTTLIDIFRRHDLSGWGKAGWVIVVVVLSCVGVLIYLIANHEGMAERRRKHEQAAQADVDAYIRAAAVAAARPARSSAPRACWTAVPTSAEFEHIKRRALGESATTTPSPAGTET